MIYTYIIAWRRSRFHRKSSWNGIMAYDGFYDKNSKGWDIYTTPTALLVLSCRANFYMNTVSIVKKNDNKLSNIIPLSTCKLRWLLQNLDK